MTADKHSCAFRGSTKDNFSKFYDARVGADSQSRTAPKLESTIPQTLIFHFYH